MTIYTPITEVTGPYSKAFVRWLEIILMSRQNVIITTKNNEKQEDLNHKLYLR